MPMVEMYTFFKFFWLLVILSIRGFFIILNSESKAMLF